MDFTCDRCDVHVHTDRLFPMGWYAVTVSWEGVVETRDVLLFCDACSRTPLGPISGWFFYKMPKEPAS